METAAAPPRFTKAERSGYTAEELAPYMTGKCPWPHFERMVIERMVNIIAAGGGLRPSGVMWFLPEIKSTPLTTFPQWARYFMSSTQGGNNDGTGYVLVYDTAPGGLIERGYGGKVALCQHLKTDTGDRDGHRRGWHPGFCSLCGLDMTVDSGD